MILVNSDDHLVGDRASTTNHRWRSLFPFGVVLGSLDPIINDRPEFQVQKNRFIIGASKPTMIW
ncbi:hypothetical protein [Lonepinella koalarum]|uniref:hypothetical protein n=1 Tax=Lonepinella koalarum TaxID=53417 RepID=UPI001892DE36|nr:hypothetical protein [Lonepinella koalarum]